MELSIDALTTCRALNLNARERLVYLVLSCYANEKGCFRLTERQLRDDLQVASPGQARARIAELVEARAVYSLDLVDGMLVGYIARLRLDAMEPVTASIVLGESSDGDEDGQYGDLR